MKLATTFLGAFMLPQTQALMGWGACPEVPSLDNGSEKLSID